MHLRPPGGDGRSRGKCWGWGRGNCPLKIQITKPVFRGPCNCSWQVLLLFAANRIVPFLPRPLRAQGRPHPPRVRGEWGPGNGAQELQLLQASSRLLTVPRVSGGLCSATWAPAGREQIPEQKDWKQRPRGQGPSWEGTLRDLWLAWELPGSNHPQPPSPGPAPMGDSTRRRGRPGPPGKPLATGKLLGKVYLCSLSLPLGCSGPPGHHSSGGHRDAGPGRPNAWLTSLFPR